MTELRIDHLPLNAIVFAERNPKRHHADLGASIDRFGFADAPIMDERTGRLVAGHGRVEQLRAMREKGEAAPAGVDPAAGAWLVPVQRGWSSRSDAEAAAFLVAHNKIGEAGGWSDEELGALLKSLGSDVETKGLGFTDEELTRLIGSEQDWGEALGDLPEGEREIGDVVIRFMLPADDAEFVNSGLESYAKEKGVEGTNSKGRALVAMVKQVAP